MNKTFGFYGSGSYCVSKAALHLKDCFRLLWEQHVYWTRMVIMGIAFGLPDLEASTNRLLSNAPDFARVFGRYYGNAIAAEFEGLIRDHLTLAAELVTAVKAGNSKAAESIERRWYKNANAIACFLSQINSCWPYKHMKSMWFEHLSLTKDEAAAILGNQHARSIELFDQIERLALQMADDFACGIVFQFSL